jgi:hypothetical protein
MPSILLKRRVYFTNQCPTQRFEAFRRHMEPLFDIVAASVTAGADSSSTGVRALLIGDLWLFDARFPQARYERSAKRIRRDDVDLLVINAFGCGKWGGVMNGAFAEREGARLQLVDCAREQSYETTEVQYCGVALRRREVENRIRDWRWLDDFDLEGANSNFLHEYLRLLGRLAYDMPLHAVEGLEKVTYDLVAACLRPSPELLECAGPGLEATMLSRISRHMDRHLSDDKLSPGSICAAIGVSRRTLYRLFEPVGGVGRHVQNLVRLRK